MAIASALAVTLLAIPVGAHAATIVPTIVGEDGNGGLDEVGCSLREAVQAANTNAPFSLCNGDNAGADKIVLHSGLTYTLSTHAIDDNNVGGDLDITGPTTITTDGPGLATIDAASNTLPFPPVGADRAIHVLSTAGGVTLDHLRITGGHVDAADFGGGGGILTNAPLTLVNSEVESNAVTGTAHSDGGGIYAKGSLATLSVINSTVADNTGQTVGNASPQTAGGGIAAYKGSTALNITNSTVSGNTVTGGGGGAAGVGIVAGVLAGDCCDHPVATLNHVTITDNQAVGLGSSNGGLLLRAGSMTGNLIAGNHDNFDNTPDCDLAGFTSGGGNLIGDDGNVTCTLGLMNGPGDLVGPHGSPIVPNIGTLLDNGGLTRTHALNPGSPAIDRGGTTCPDTDQRGFFRAPVAPCDAGAVELGAPSSLPSQPGTQPGVAPAPAPQATTTPRKCKKKRKHRSASAAKKCKKKK